MRFFATLRMTHTDKFSLQSLLILQRARILKLGMRVHNSKRPYGQKRVSSMIWGIVVRCNFRAFSIMNKGVAKNGEARYAD